MSTHAPTGEPPRQFSGDALGAIRELLGGSYFHPATEADAVDGVAPCHVAEPATAVQVAGLLKLCDEADLSVIARGSGSKLDWGNPPARADLILSTRRLDRVLEHASGDMTATVQSGCSVAALGQCLAERGQRLALDPLWPDRATVGGIIATNDSGAMRAAYGSLRDFLIGITVALPDGTLARSGGKVVKNVAGYDLPKLFTGSFGTLGVITEATFRLYPLAKATRLWRCSVPTTRVLAQVMSALAGCSLLCSGVQLEADGAAPINVTEHPSSGKQAATAPIAVCVMVEGLAEVIDGKLRRVTQACLDCGATDCGDTRAGPTADLGAARERLFAGGDSCVAKISLLPSAWPPLLDRMRELCAGGGFSWKAVAQAIGVGLMQIASTGQLEPAMRAVRAEVEKAGGSMLVLRCPPGMKGPIAVWPAGGTSLPLMRRIKEQFDPRAILSPGRFLGGI